MSNRVTLDTQSNHILATPTTGRTRMVPSSRNRAAAIQIESPGLATNHIQTQIRSRSSSSPH